MGCHTWIYKKVEDLTKDEYDYLSKKCNNSINSILSDNRSAKELYDLYKKHYGCSNSIEEIEQINKSNKEIAEYVKNNMDKDPSLMKHYVLTCNYNNEVYFNVGTYDEFRILNYPENIFTNAKDLIEYCENNNWNNIYFYDDNEERVPAIKKIEDAKKVINTMFKNKNIIVTFG